MPETQSKKKRNRKTNNSDSKQKDILREENTEVGHQICTNEQDEILTNGEEHDRVESHSLKDELEHWKGLAEDSRKAYEENEARFAKWTFELQNQLINAYTFQCSELEKQLQEKSLLLLNRTSKINDTLKNVITKIMSDKTSDQVITVDPNIQTMFQNFVSKMDEIVHERDSVLSNRMNHVTGSLTKLSQSVRVIEEKKKQQHEKREKELLQQIEDLKSLLAQQQQQEKQSSSQENSDQHSSELEKLLKEEQKKVADKVAELDSLQKKVADWKDKVKQITTRDTQTIQQLKKQLKERDDQIQQLSETSSTITTPSSPFPETSDQQPNLEVQALRNNLNQLREQLQEREEKIVQLQSGIKKIQEENELIQRQQANPQETLEAQQTQAEPQQESQETVNNNFIILHRVAIDEAHIQCLLQYKHDKSLRWIDQNELQMTSEMIEYPPTFSETLSSTIKEWQDKVDTIKSELATKEEELRMYKARAHAALKKKTESATKIQVECESKMASLQDELKKVNDKYEELKEHERELEQQVAQLIDVQSESIRIADELDQSQRDREELNEKLRIAESKLKELEQRYAREKSEAQQLYNDAANKHEERIAELEAQNRKELQVHRERTRRMMDEKEREIAKLQMRLTTMRRDQLAEIEQIKLETERQLNEQQERALARPFINESNDGAGHSIDVQSKEPSNVEQSAPQQQETIAPQRPMMKESDIIRSVLAPVESKQDLNVDQQVEIKIEEKNDEQIDKEMERLMHLAQLQASRDGELVQYKRSVHQLQAQLEEKENTMRSFKELEIHLRREIEHLQTLYQNGTPNLQYLKNVLIKFLETKDAKVRDKLFKVVSTMLDFTVQEQDQIRQSWVVSSSIPSASSGIFSIVS